jgi:hypothetical protein
MGIPIGPAYELNTPGVLQRAAAMILRSCALEGGSPRPDFAASAMCAMVAGIVSELDRLDDTITEKGAEGAIEVLHEAVAKMSAGKDPDVREGIRAAIDFIGTMLRMSAKANARARVAYTQGYAPAGVPGYPPRSSPPTPEDPLDDPYLAPEVKIARIIAKHGADPAAWPEKARECADRYKADVDAARRGNPLSVIMDAVFSHGSDRSQWSAEAQKAADDLVAMLSRTASAAPRFIGWGLTPQGTWLAVSTSDTEPGATAGLLAFAREQGWPVGTPVRLERGSVVIAAGCTTEEGVRLDDPRNVGVLRGAPTPDGGTN